MAISTSDSGIETECHGEEHLHIHSAFYQDILVLRPSFMVNGKPARITGSVESGSPQLYCSDIGMSVSMSAVTKVCTSILHKHGISHSNVYCDDQSPLVSFQYRPGLIERLFPECANIAQDISRAVRAIFKRADASISIGVEAAARLYLISPSRSGAPETLLITPSNIQQCSDRLDQSKEFLFSSSMFAEYNAENKQQGTKVDFNDLVHVLWSSSAKWRSLGTRLHIPQHNLEKIKKDHPDSSDECLVSMLQWWCNNARPSWARVMSAVCDIDRRDIAEEISVKYYGIKHPADVLKLMTKDVPPTMDPIDEEFSETENAGTLREAKRSVSALTRECKRLRNERDELKTDIEHERKKYEERMCKREENIDLLEDVVDKMEQELEKCKEINRTLSSQIEQKENNLEEKLRITKLNLQTMESELNNALEQLSVKQIELEDQSKRLKGLEESEAIQTDELNMSQSPLLRSERVIPQGSTTTMEASSQHSYAETRQRSLGEVDHHSTKEKLQLEEDLKYRLMEKRMRLFKMKHTEEERDLSKESALKTEIKELTASLKEPVEIGEETEIRSRAVVFGQHEHHQDAVQSRQALTQSENIHVYRSRRNSLPSYVKSEHKRMRKTD